MSDSETRPNPILFDECYECGEKIVLGLAVSYPVGGFESLRIRLHADCFKGFLERNRVGSAPGSPESGSGREDIM